MLQKLLAYSFFLFSAVEIRELQGACQIWALVDTIMIQLVIKHFWNLIKVRPASNIQRFMYFNQ